MMLVDHPQRRALNDEVHARPPERLRAPMRLTYLAMFSSGDRTKDTAAIQSLITMMSGKPLGEEQNHYSADFGSFRVKWERHNEFVRYKFFVSGDEAHLFSDPAINVVPKEWLASLPGEVIAANHAVLLPMPEEQIRTDQLSDEVFAGNALIGSTTSGGKGIVLTDFRIHADGFGRIVFYDGGLTPRQFGRLVQRIMEIDTYRSMALLTFPIAKELSPFLHHSEQELLSIIAGMEHATEEDEPELFDRITHLEAQVERRRSDTHFRFSAGDAYYDIVQSRVEDLREGRIEGLQTFREFNDRRLAPAMATCHAVFSRHEALLERIGRTTLLLSTRVNVTREKQNQAVLKSLDRRANLQLRLQQTVEGLSVAAISYYIVGLVGYGVKGLKAYGVDINADIAVAVSIPIVVGIVAFGLWRFHKALDKDFRK
ncbi:MAG: DUF3422 domain-containing protein [Beijerinckiaceae bacterium]|nr:DUF3422 domain-containing protein [Beijerinckiaceae bacterium]